MANKIKIELTLAQLIAVIEITNECSSGIGGGDVDADKNRVKWVRLVDRMLKNNGYKRDFK